MWSKISLFEQATRVPMIVRIPGITDGASCGEIVELVDLYPTLCNILEIALPHDKLEGISFLPLVETPDLAWKKAAFTVCRQGRHLGRSVRTKSHRYTEWVDYADRDDDHAVVRFAELYHLDVDELEQVNSMMRRDLPLDALGTVSAFNFGSLACLPKKPAGSDITLGDFYGAEDIRPLCIMNTDKGDL